MRFKNAMFIKFGVNSRIENICAKTDGTLRVDFENKAAFRVWKFRGKFYKKRLS